MSPIEEDCFERRYLIMTAILTMVGFILGVVAGARVIKLVVRCINSLFDRIEERI